jgi:murein lipoprotein
MINTKMMVGAVIVASTLLAGCSKSETANTAMNAQLNQLASDVQYAKSEAERANQRIDNLSRVSSYTK